MVNDFVKKKLHKRNKNDICLPTTLPVCKHVHPTRLLKNTLASLLLQKKIRLYYLLITRKITTYIQNDVI